MYEEAASGRLLHIQPKYLIQSHLTVMPKIIAGSPNFFINGKPAARVGDATDNKSGTGLIMEGSPDFIVNRKKAAREGDAVAPKSVGMVLQGSPDFFVNGIPLARMGDKA